MLAKQFPICYNTREVILVEFRILTESEKCRYRDELLGILSINDKNFLPPLSQRSSTTQSNLQGTAGEEDILPYFNKMMEQNVLAMFFEGKLFGFVSYIDNYVSGVITEETHPNIYLSTLALRPESRGMGATKKAYTHLFFDRYPHCNVYTRTWSTNGPHIHILGGFGFEELKRIPNDRGKGIDTVYFCKKREK